MQDSCQVVYNLHLQPNLLNQGYDLTTIQEQQHKNQVLYTHIGTSVEEIFIRLSYSPTYFFSNSPVKWRFTNVVFPVPPSPTRTS